jgi:hypothetical protein
LLLKMTANSKINAMRTKDKRNTMIDLFFQSVNL